MTKLLFTYTPRVLSIALHHSPLVFFFAFFFMLFRNERNCFSDGNFRSSILWTFNVFIARGTHSFPLIFSRDCVSRRAQRIDFTSLSIPRLPRISRTETFRFIYSPASTLFNFVGTASISSPCAPFSLTLATFSS